MNESCHTYDMIPCVCGITYEYLTRDTLCMWIRDMILCVCATAYEYYVTLIHMCMSHICMRRVTHMTWYLVYVACICGITYEYQTCEHWCMWIHDMILCVCATTYEYVIRATSHHIWIHHPCDVAQCTWHQCMWHHIWSRDSCDVAQMDTSSRTYKCVMPHTWCIWVTSQGGQEQVCGGYD